MNAYVWVVWAAQGSKEINKFENFLATFEGVFFNFSWSKFIFFEYCSVRTKKFLMTFFFAQNTLPIRIQIMIVKEILAF